MIKAAIVGESELIARLERFPDSLRNQLRSTVESLAITLTSKVKKDKLSGQVLRRRTGRLSRSINYKLDVQPSAVYATVGTNVEYAKALEYGFDGTVSVKAHLRKIKGGTVQNVKVHDRHMKIAPHSFLRSALADMKTQIRSEITAVTRQIAQEALKK